MTVREIGYGTHRYIWDTLDTKPTAATHSCKQGDTGYDRETGIMYITYDGTNWVEKDTIVRLETSPTIDIGNVELVTNDQDEVTDDVADAVKVLIVGSAGTSEDMFGTPSLDAGGNGRATWDKDPETSANSVRQKWAVRLDAGYQTGWNDFAKVNVPINEMAFTDLDSVRLEAYYPGITDGLDMAVCVYMHDPENINDFVELSHTPQSSTGAGRRELNFPTEPGGISWFWYGTVTDTPDTCPTEGGSYTWAQFQADSVFSTWKIYRISFDSGYGNNNGVMNGTYLCQAQINGITIPLEPTLEEQITLAVDQHLNAIKIVPTWLYGQPTVFAHNNARANWERGRWDVSTHQKGHTFWNARLYGGLQTGGTSAAGVSIPVNDIPIPDFDSAKWTYYMDAAMAYGVNIVFWVHDPDDFDIRCEITQSGSATGLEKANAQNAHEFPSGDADMFYVGEISGTPDTCPTQYGLYTWAQFKADSVFSRYTIYRITFEFGMYNTGTFTNAYLEDVELNGTHIQLQPANGKYKKTVTKSKTLVGGANAAFDVLSESVDAGTEWTFEFGGQGKIINAVMTIATTALTAETSLHLFGKALTCNLYDNVANTSPIAADVPYFYGAIEFAALRDYGTTSLSYTHASSGTVGGLPIYFDTDIVRAVLISVDAMTPGAVLCTISLTAEMEYN